MEADKHKVIGPVRRVWLLIGGLGGLIAIIGIAIGLSQILQAESTRRSGDRAQATVVAIMSAQLNVQQEIATLQAVSIKAGPTATIVAAKVAELQATNEALDADRLQAEKAATAAARRGGVVANGAATTGMKVASQVAGVSVELLEFGRFENTVTVKLRCTNSGEGDAHVSFTDGSYLLDEATQTKYPVTEQSNGWPGFTIAAGNSLDVWAKYPLSGEVRPQYLTVVLQSGVLFEHVKLE